MSSVDLPAAAGERRLALATAPLPRRALVVLGMHRSGTSALARVLSLCGAHLPENVMPRLAGSPADANSVHGFWESQPLVELNEQALASAGSSWDDPCALPESWFQSATATGFAERLTEALREEFGTAPLFVAKDPRISRLVPLWEAALGRLGVEAHWLIAVRNPLEVAHSLRHRDGFPLAKGLVLWLSYLLTAERSTRRHNRIFVRYEDLLANWRGVVMRIENRFALALPRRSQRAGDEIERYLDPALRHHAVTAIDLERRADVADSVKEVFGWAMRAAAAQAGEAELDAAHAVVAEAEAVFGPLLAAQEHDLEGSRLREQALTAEVEQLRRQVAEGLEQLARSGEQLGRRDEQLAAAESQRRQTEEQLAAAESQRRQTEEQLAAAESQRRQTEEQLAGLQVRLGEVEPALVASRAETARLQALATAGEDALARAGAELTELRAMVARREQAALASGAQIAALLAQRREDRAHREQLAAQVDEALSLGATREAELCATVEQLRGELRALAGAMAERRPRVRTVAFYLPQFHPIPENDAWWGRGFTDWANVVAASPGFAGHQQPQLPSELGFYDLRLPEVRAAQAELAREHGIDGFCYYYYWFAGRRLLERPLEEMLASGVPDFPFCLCWANENWTRRWDGEDDKVLIAQDHSPESDQRFIEDVLPYLRDPRYITRNGDPLLLVYRADLIRDPLRTTRAWREAARRAGLPGLHLCAVWRVDDPLAIGFDGLVEFPPHHFPHFRLTDHYRSPEGTFAGEVFDYAAGVEAVEPLEDPGFPVYRGVMPGWDNTPRRGAQARIFINSTPEAYGGWLERMLRESRERALEDDQFVFINAWNEWGEGAALEPSRAHGRAYLEATHAAVRAARRPEEAGGNPGAEGPPRLPWSRLAGTAGETARRGGSRASDEQREAAERLTTAEQEAVARAAAERAEAERAAVEQAAAELRMQRLDELRKRALSGTLVQPHRELWLSPHFGALALLRLPLWLLTGRLATRWRWWRQGRAILRSGLFDPGYYRSLYTDVRERGISPLYHYVRFGAAEGRNPNPYFCGRSYLERWPEVVPGDNPLLHYLAREPDGAALEGSEPAAGATVSTPFLPEGASVAPAVAVEAPRATLDTALVTASWRRNEAHARSRSAGSRPLLFVSHDAARAGAQLILLETIGHLAARRDLELFVLLLDGGELARDFARHAHTLELGTLLPACDGSRDAAIQGVVEEMAGRRPLLVLCNTVVSSAVAVACRRAQLPVLAMIYELPTSLESAYGRQRLADIVACAHRVVLPSQFVKDALMHRYRLAEDRLTVLHTGAFPCDRSAGARERCRTRVLTELGLTEETFLVIGCGTIHPRKGVDLFVQVAREAYELGAGEGQMVFAWVGPDQLGPLTRVWCEHDVTAAGLDGRVKFLGSRERTDDYFGAADAFVLTSREDPFPMVALEAMARGVPIVAFEGSGGTAEAIAGGAGVLVPYLDVKRMARALVCLCEAPHHRAEVGRRGQQRIEDDLGWDRYMERLIRILESDFGYRSPREAAPSV